MLSALIAIVLLVIVTGALHEDGLADVADGFFGGHDRATKLAIMRDSAIGTYGTLALMGSLGIRVLCLAALIGTHDIGTAMLAFLAVGGLSRAAMLIPWSLMPAARPIESVTPNEAIEKPAAGLSARYGAPNREIALPALLFAIPALVALILAVGMVGAIMALCAGLGVTYLTMRLADRHIGGHTGDVLGATQQLSEAGLYLALVIAM